MNPTDSSLAGLVLAATIGALLVACAQTPDAPATQVAGLDCAALAGEMRSATEAQRAAAQQQQDAWKVVVPFAVAARYARGKSAARESEQRLAALQQQAARHGCPQP